MMQSTLRSNFGKYPLSRLVKEQGLLLGIEQSVQFEELSGIEYWLGGRNAPVTSLH